jgi:hypothetical protein
MRLNRVSTLRLVVVIVDQNVGTERIMKQCDVVFWPILLQKSAILVVGLPLRPLEADSDYSFSHWTLVGV